MTYIMAKDITVGTVLIGNRYTDAGEVVSVERGQAWLDDSQDGLYRIDDAVLIEVREEYGHIYSYKLDPEDHDVPVEEEEA